MQTKLDRALHYIDNLNIWIGKIVSVLVLIIAMAMIYGVIMRNFFNSPQAWTIELSSMLLLSVFMLAAGNVHYHGGHVKMDLIYERFSPKKKALIDLITSICFFFFCGLGIYVGTKNGIDSFLAAERSSSIWSPVVWPAKLTIPLGFILFLLQGIAKYIRDIRLLQGRDKNEY